MHSFYLFWQHFSGMVELWEEVQDLLLLSQMSQMEASEQQHWQKVCRFCGNQLQNWDQHQFGPTADQGCVCDHSDCQQLMSLACSVTLECGHLCSGVNGETECLKCLKCHNDNSLKQDADDLCVICFTDRLGIRLFFGLIHNISEKLCCI